MLLMLLKPNLQDSRMIHRDFKAIIFLNRDYSTEAARKRLLFLDKETSNSKRTENLVLFFLISRLRTEAETTKLSLIERSSMT